MRCHESPRNLAQLWPLSAIRYVLLLLFLSGYGGFFVSRAITQFGQGCDHLVLLSLFFIPFRLSMTKSLARSFSVAEWACLDIWQALFCLATANCC